MTGIFPSLLAFVRLWIAPGRRFVEAREAGAFPDFAVALVISGYVGIYISRTCSTDMLGFGSGSGWPSNTNSRSSVVAVTGMETLPPVHSWIGCLSLNHWPVLLGSLCLAAQRLRAAVLSCLSTRAAESAQF